MANLTTSKLKQTSLEFEQVKELVNRYNAGELSGLNEKDLEQIAILAAQMGIEFKVKSKPIRKGLFDLADTAAFGLIPNELRPTSIGQEWHGESGIDKFAGGVGTLGGAALGGLGVLKLAGKARGLAGNFGNMFNFKNPFGTYGGSNKVAQMNPQRDKLLIDAANRYLPRTPGYLPKPPGYLPSHLGRKVPSTPGMGEVVNIMGRAY